MDIRLYWHEEEMVHAREFVCMTAGVRGKPAALETSNTEMKLSIPPLSDGFHMVVIHPALSQYFLDHPPYKHGESSKHMKNTWMFYLNFICRNWYQVDLWSFVYNLSVYCSLREVLVTLYGFVPYIAQRSSDLENYCGVFFLYQHTQRRFRPSSCI